MNGRKTLCLLACVMLLLTMASCTEAVTLPEANYSLTVTEEYLKLGGNTLKLMYPTVSGYADAEKEAAVNEAAAAIARRMYEEEGLMYDSEGGYAYMAARAEVMLAAQDFYSVVITGTISSTVSGGVDTFAYTLNCDLANAVFLDAEAIIGDYPALVKSFTGDLFTVDFGGEALEDGQFSRASLIEQYKAAYGIYPCVYFREGRFGILAETLPSLGDGCTGLSADVRRIADCLRTENPAIAALCGIEVPE